MLEITFSLARAGGPVSPPGEYQGWLDPEHIEAAIIRQQEETGTKQALAEHNRKCQLLLRQADVLFELCDQENLRAATTGNAFSSNAFPISELEKHLWPARFRNLAIIEVPWMFPATDGKPRLPELLSAMDAVLKRNQVRRRIFMTTNYWHSCWLDSDESR